MIVGLTTGVYDLFHDGHRHFLRECVLNCDALWVALNSDVSVQTMKGSDRPAEPLEQRQKAVALFLRLVGVRAATLLEFENETALANLVNMARPDVIFKGSEYHGTDFPTAGARVHYIQRVSAFGSTTSEIAKRRG